MLVRLTVFAGLLFLYFMPGLSGSVFANERHVTFIQLNDLHANLIPHRDLVRKVGADGKAHSVVEMRGGLARIATLVQGIRKESPEAILMNIGDTYHGGAEALYTRGNAIVAPVEALGIDIGVPGNWDFAYGPITTRMRYAPQSSPLSAIVNKLLFGEPVAVPGYTVLTANVRKTLGILGEDEPLLPATSVLEIGHVKVGFIGITSDIVARMSPMLAWGFTFLQGETAYRDMINKHSQQLRNEGADLVVIMSELGLHRDRQLANVIAPGVDIFFSAHTHEVTPVPLTSTSGALVVEAGNDGFLGKMFVTLYADASVGFDWELLPVDKHVREDPQMLKLVAVARAPFLQQDVKLSYPMPGVSLPLTAPLNTIISPAPMTLHRRNVLDSPFNHYLAELMRAQYGSDLALTPGFRFDAVIPEGEDITLEDLYRYLPVPPVLSRGNITGKNLKKVFETELTRVFSKDAFEHSGGWLPGISGVELILDLERDTNERVISMQRTSNGSLIKPEDVLTVVSCTRPFDDPDVLCSNGGFTDIEQLDSPWGGNWTPLELLRYSLEKQVRINDKQGAIKETSNITRWPESRFIQPLH